MAYKFQTTEELQKECKDNGTTVRKDLMQYSTSVFEASNYILEKMPEYWKKTINHLDLGLSKSFKIPAFSGNKNMYHTGLYPILMNYFLYESKETHMFSFNERVYILPIAEHYGIHRGRDSSEYISKIKFDLEKYFKDFLKVNNIIVDTNNLLKVYVQLA